MINRLPPWFEQEIPEEAALKRMRLVSGLQVNTVCREAKCPNIGHCFKKNKLTFMILGDTCTRSCRFCGVKKSFVPERLPFDPDEPQRIADAVKELGIKYAVITSVTRDDLSDGGAKQFAETIKCIRKVDAGIKIEVLIPDFRGDEACLKQVLSEHPEVLAHNIETVNSLYPQLRPEADYRRSLGVLKSARELAPAVNTKSSLMLGLGEKKAEVVATMEDLRYNGCDILALGQYLSPSDDHYPVKEFIGIQRFREYKRIGAELGFKAVFSGPLVRSSYHAEELYEEFINA